MPVLGPGVPGKVAKWCDVTSVKDDERVKSVTLPDGVSWDDVVQAASEELYEASGERWAGLRTDTIRWRRIAGQGAAGWWLWSDAASTIWNREFPEGWALGSETEIILPGPVTAIPSIKVDGVVFDPSKYLVYDNRRLIRVDGQAWPLGQRLENATTEVGTFEIVVTHGAAPPTSGALAAREWSIQKGLLASTERTKLPQRTTQVQRNGVNITIERGDLLKDGKTGIPLVDSFLTFYNPKRVTRRARSYSVDSPAPAVSSTSQT